jgi:hypothetical protein
VFGRFAWKLKIHNYIGAPQRFDATIEFHDKDGFVIDSDREYGLVVPGQTVQEFTGDKLITAATAPRVTGAKAKVVVR